MLVVRTRLEGMSQCEQRFIRSGEKLCKSRERESKWLGIPFKNSNQLSTQNSRWTSSVATRKQFPPWQIYCSYNIYCSPLVHVNNYLENLMQSNIREPNATIVVNADPMRHIEQAPTPRAHHLSRFGVQHNYCVLIDWPFLHSGKVVRVIERPVIDVHIDKSNLA